jgi:hypothetical protein
MITFGILTLGLLISTAMYFKGEENKEKAILGLLITGTLLINLIIGAFITSIIVVYTFIAYNLDFIKTTFPTQVDWVIEKVKKLKSLYEKLRKEYF